MPSLRRLSFRPLAVLLAAGASLASSPARADDPVLRHQEDLHGDVVVFGSTLGFDCGAGLPAPAGATASCAGQLNIVDGAPDLWWRDNIADSSVTSTDARTSATLTLPAGATITYARLYWAALKVGADPDTDATLDWLGGPQQTIVADTTWSVPYPFVSHPDWFYYQSSGDATDFVATWGAGDFRVSDVESIDLIGQDVDRVFSAWTLVVFYENPGDGLRNLALFDSFTPLDPGVAGQGSAEVTLSGFLVPSAFTARMSAFAYEGDTIYTGDHFTLNHTQITDALNPADNFFNSTRSYLGSPVSGTSDVPKLSGQVGSMAGYDLDTADVTSLLKPGDTSCTVGADSTKDVFFLGGFITSVASLAPDFHGMAKDVVDLNGGAILPNDILEYTITAVNSGNDAATFAELTDVLDPGLSLVAGSIEIMEGGAVGTKTNAGGDDEGDYDAASRTITWRVGTGADAFTGGTVHVGGTVKVRFHAKVTAQTGVIANQAILAASGESGAPDKTWSSDGDPATLGDQPTTVVVDECSSDTQCSGTKPHCNLTTHTCEGCASDADCPSPGKPACEPSGACGVCSASNHTLCTGNTPVCDTMAGDCVLCTLGPSGNADQCKADPQGPLCVAGMGGTVHCGCTADGDCGDAVSGQVCDSVPAICVDGCRGMGGNGCPTGQKCTSADTTIGSCVPDTGAGGGGTGGGSGGGGADPGDQSKCGCEVPGADHGQGGMAALAAMLGLGAMARRRRARR
jgi:fimbrial isopeptide formation D2 family protein/MYXO-CTERM domain-containing protein